MRATAVFTLGTFAALVVMSLLLSSLISGLRRGKKFFQLAYYSPAVLSSVVAATIWLLIFDPRGLANQAVNALMNTPGVDHDWFINPFMEQLSTMLVYFWKYIGYFVIICIAGMASIPPSIYEATHLDGATKWQTYWRITFPLLRPTVVLVSIMSMLQCLRTFSVQYLFTLGGAPLNAINVITLNIYHTGIRYYRIGRASAMSIILLVIMVVLTWIQFRGSRSRRGDLLMAHETPLGTAGGVAAAVVKYAILVALLVFILAPLVFMLTASFMPARDIITHAVPVGAEEPLHPELPEGHRGQRPHLPVLPVVPQLADRGLDRDGVHDRHRVARRATASRSSASRAGTSCSC